MSASASPRVAVVCACRDQGRFAPEMAASVAAQTLRDHELVIVDDGSADDTWHQLQQLAGGRVTVLRAPPEGPSAARNRAVRATSAPLLFNLDADDRIAPTFLEAACAVLEADPAAGIVCSRAVTFGARTGPLPLPRPGLPGMLHDNAIPSIAAMRRSDFEAVGGYSTDCVHGLEDWDLWLSILGLGRRAVRIEEELTLIRTHRSASLSRSGRRRRHRRVQREALLTVFRRHRPLFEAYPDALAPMLRLERQERTETPLGGLLRDAVHRLRSAVRR